MWPVKLHFKNSVRRIKAGATAGISLHMTAPLRDSDTVVLINRDCSFEIAFRGTLKTKSCLGVICFWPDTAEASPDALLADITVCWWPKQKKSWSQTALRFQFPLSELPKCPSFRQGDHSPLKFTVSIQERHPGASLCNAVSVLPT